MRVKFRTNLGSRDAATYGLNHEECTLGAVVEAGKRAANALAARGLADIIGEPEIKAAPTPEIHAVPEAPVIAEVKEVEIKAGVKPTKKLKQ